MKISNEIYIELFKAFIVNKAHKGHSRDFIKCKTRFESTNSNLYSLMATLWTSTYSPINRVLNRLIDNDNISTIDIINLHKLNSKWIKVFTEFQKFVDNRCNEQPWLDYETYRTHYDQMHLIHKKWSQAQPTIYTGEQGLNTINKVIHNYTVHGTDPVSSGQGLKQQIQDSNKHFYQSYTLSTQGTITESE